MTSQFKLSSLFRRHEPEDGPSLVPPPELHLWVWATSASLASGLLSGALRGSRLGWARAQAIIHSQGIDRAQRRPLIASLMYGEMARSALRTGGRLSLFVGCLLGK